MRTSGSSSSITRGGSSTSGASPSLPSAPPSTPRRDSRRGQRDRASAARVSRSGGSPTYYGAWRREVPTGDSEVRDPLASVLRLLADFRPVLLARVVVDLDRDALAVEAIAAIALAA